MSTHGTRSEEHTSELQSHSEISYAVFCLKNKKPKDVPATYSRRQALRLGGATVLGLAAGCSAAETLGPGLPVAADVFFFLMIRRPPRSTPYPTLFPTRRSSDLSSLPLPDPQHADLFGAAATSCLLAVPRSEEHTSELQSHSEISYAVFCLKK